MIAPNLEDADPERLPPNPRPWASAIAAIAHHAAAPSLSVRVIAYPLENLTTDSEYVS